jgi:hypothetical protein
MSRPWKARETRVYFDGGGFDVRDCPDPEQLAIFIVEAVNSYEAQATLIKELVEALEGVLPLVKPKTDTDSERMAEARVALFHAAKAKAVQP